MNNNKVRNINKDKLIFYIITLVILGIFASILIYSAVVFVKENFTEKSSLSDEISNDNGDEVLNDKGIGSSIGNNKLSDNIDEKEQLSPLPQKFLNSISTGSTENGDVSVILTPKGKTESKLAVEISINTHSVDLSQFNLKEITRLEYDGKMINPISAPSLQGHHVSGELVFQIDMNKDINIINDLVIKIIGIPQTNERIFKW